MTCTIEQPTIRVTWKGKRIGHGRWIERTVIVHSEDDARALVAAPMEADFHTVYADVSEPSRWRQLATRTRKH